MCRFVLYLGPRTRLSSLIVDPGHSLIRQSVHSREREEPLNGDGFGVGWYANDLSVEPAVFRSITPAWNNRNLQNLARVVASDCVLAHVRAATQSSGVNEANCHPFRWRRYLCMHNGDIGDFRARSPQTARERLRRGVRERLRQHGLGALLRAVHRLVARARRDDPARAHGARAEARDRARAHPRAQAGAGSYSYLNVAIADGDRAVVSRFTDDPEAAPESLYWFSGSLYPELPDHGHGHASRGDGELGAADRRSGLGRGAAGADHHPAPRSRAGVHARARAGELAAHRSNRSSERSCAIDSSHWAAALVMRSWIARGDRRSERFGMVLEPPREPCRDGSRIGATSAGHLRRELPLVELRVKTRGRDELGVRAALDDPARPVSRGSDRRAARWTAGARSRSPSGRRARVRARPAPRPRNSSRGARWLRRARRGPAPSSSSRAIASRCFSPPEKR